MKFHVVTPSYNSLKWLRLALPSVCDQAGKNIIVHHHVQDASSKDGTPEFLAEWARRSEGVPGYSFSFASEPDEGMYDAINRGWSRAAADADVLAHLNSDEQYLPGAFEAIAHAFLANPQVDLVFGDLIVIDRDGHYICHRRALHPHPWTSRYIWGGQTATTFQRRDVFFGKGVKFDTSWRIVGDLVWYNLLHKAGCRFAVVHSMTSTFADTGTNLAWTEKGVQEGKLYAQKYRGGRMWLGRLVTKCVNLKRAVIDAFLPKPRQYAIYTADSPDERKTFPITHPTPLWRVNLADKVD